MKPDEHYVFEFGPFRLDPVEHLLLHDRIPVHLTEKAFDTLLVLIQRRGHLVEKSELIAAVWQESFVEEGNLTVTVSMLRRALDDHPHESRYIETVPKRGYRFVADVCRIDISELDVPNGIKAAMEFVPLLESTPPRPVWELFQNRWMLISFALLLVLIGFTIAVSFVEAPRPSVAPRGGDPSMVGVSSASKKSDFTGGTQDWEAYRLYLEGRYFWDKKTEGGLRRSVERFQEAVARDPHYAEAYVGLAESYMLLASFGMESTQEAYPSAKSAALKAIKIDESLEEAHTCLGTLSLLYDWNWSNAESEFHIALVAKPNDAEAYMGYAGALAATGQLDEALKDAELAHELDPVSLRINIALGRVYYLNRSYDEATSTFRHVLELEPGYSRAYTRLGITYIAKGNYSNAVQQLQEALRLSGRDADVEGLLGYAEALNGDKKSTLGILTELTERSRQQYVPAFSMAFIHLGLGDHQKALEWLLKASEDRLGYLAYAGVDPLFDPFRSDQQFVALLNRMGLRHTKRLQTAFKPST